MYSGTTRMGELFKNPLDIGLSAELDTEATFTQLEQRTFLVARLSNLMLWGTASWVQCQYFTTNDCSGTCYSPQELQIPSDIIPPKIVAARYIYNNPTLPLYIFDFSLISTKTFNSNLTGYPSNTCQDLSGTPQTMKAAAGAPYALPNGLSYPIPSINFKAD